MNIEIIDKWLDEEYGISYTELEELHNRLVDKNIELDIKYIKALEVAQERFDRIQKAIEYISKHNCIATYEEYKPTEYEYCCSADLLDILKGSDKDIPGFEGTLEALDNLSIKGGNNE